MSHWIRKKTDDSQGRLTSWTRSADHAHRTMSLFCPHTLQECGFLSHSRVQMCTRNCASETSCAPNPPRCRSNSWATAPWLRESWSQSCSSQEEKIRCWLQLHTSIKEVHPAKGKKERCGFVASLDHTQTWENELAVLTCCNLSQWVQDTGSEVVLEAAWAKCLIHNWANEC